MERREFLNGVAAATVMAGSLKAAKPAAPVKTTLACLGDLLIARKVSALKDPDFLALVKLLRDADCTWGNGEMLFLDTRLHKPGYKGIDPHVACEPWGADELAWMGVDFLGLANNHTMDFGESGMLATMANLSRTGISFCGAGADLNQAARPGFADTAAGRVGQVSFASTFADWTAASLPNIHANGRAGLNPVHMDAATTVPPDIFKGLAQVQDEAIRQMGLSMFMDLMPQDEKRKMVFLRDMRFMEGESLEFRDVVRESDKTRILNSIKAARAGSRITLATIHSHESHLDQTRPAQFMSELGKACIDAGAHAYVGTGPHRLRGIELHNGMPIFHSLGNFIFQYESMKAVPSEALMGMGLDPNTLDLNTFYEKIPYHKHQAYWESVVPLMTFEDSKLVEIQLHPIEMGFGRPSYERGVPRLARGQQAQKIIEDLATLSEPYGTAIEHHDGVGTVKLD